MQNWKLWQQALVFFAAGVILTAIGFIVTAPPRGTGIMLTPMEPKELVVHIDGEINSPGVYAMKPESRVQDVVNAAGGMKPSARSEGLNLARHISDGEKITIPSQEQAITESQADLLDLNSATLNELDDLPGIGKVRAQSIIDYRNQQGLFTSIEQLLLVPGISEDVYGGIKDLIYIR